ncbi:MAG: DUF1189 family protein [Alphaproteobacteria bacterium]|nr:DUF1189 family protein [Alphaproteobacteria bacterium]
MNKIANYVLRGRGIGALWLFVFALLFSFLAAYRLNGVLPQTVPYIQRFADDVLPVKIENGQVVEPQNTLKSLKYTVSGEPFVVEIDTTKEVLGEEAHEAGFYLTKSYFYTVSNQEIRRRALSEDLDLPKQDYTPLLYKAVDWTVASIAVLGPIVMFFYFLIGVVFYAFFCSLACALNKTELPFKAKMRLNTVLFIGLYLVLMFAAGFGLNLSMFAFFCMMLILQIIFVKKMSA